MGCVRREALAGSGSRTATGLAAGTIMRQGSRSGSSLLPQNSMRREKIWEEALRGLDLYGYIEDIKDQRAMTLPSVSGSFDPRAGIYKNCPASARSVNGFFLGNIPPVGITDRYEGSFPLGDKLMGCPEIRKRFPSGRIEVAQKFLYEGYPSEPAIKSNVLLQNQQGLSNRQTPAYNLRYFTNTSEEFSYKSSERVRRQLDLSRWISKAGALTQFKVKPRAVC